MKVQASHVTGWGVYRQYEGPYHNGLGPFKGPFATMGHKLLDTLSVVEKRSPSAVTSYGPDLLSVGFGRFREDHFEVSDLLGAIGRQNPNLLNPLQPILRQVNATFVPKEGSSKWRFHTPEGEVDCFEAQLMLFRAGAPGLRGSWQDGQKLLAREWVAALVNVLEQPEAIEVQVQFASRKAHRTVLPEALYLGFSAKVPLDDWAQAFQTIYIAYSIRDPALTNQHLKIAVARTNTPQHTPNWYREVLRELVFGPKISTHPHRYYKLRPKIAEHFGVHLPDMQEELRAWRWILDEGHDPPSGNEPRFEDPKEVQAFLLGLRYDLGPSGVDEVLGPKTREALWTFQDLHGLEGTGRVNAKTRQKLLAVFRRLNVPLTTTPPWEVSP